MATTTESKRTAQFHCLRCDHKYVDSFNPKVVEERACPSCGSNSVRRLKGAPKPN